MKDKVIISPVFKVTMLLLAGIGAVAFALGIFTDARETWASYLVSNYYFFSLAIGALFFLSIQYISQSGWSSAFSRVAEAIMAYMPYAAVFFLLLLFGLNYLYKWADKSVVSVEEVIDHKSAYLNIPFFTIRMVIFFASWIVLCYILRNISRKSDLADPGDTAVVMKFFARSEFWSKVSLFVLALTFSLFTIDLTLSVNPDWYSTIFALKNLVGAILHGVSVITLVVFILYKLGYYPFLNKFHLHDCARYIFMFSIIWGYFWFAQFMIIWYGNIPDETVYFYNRWQAGWKIIFFTELGLNWFIPFMVLLPVKASRNMTLITIVIIILIAGQYLDLFFQVMPVTSGLLKFSWIEAGVFAGIAGLFSLVVATALSRKSLYPKNHPYLEESLHHSFK
jgi:hypothetical protein